MPFDPSFAPLFEIPCVLFFDGARRTGSRPLYTLLVTLITSYDIVREAFSWRIRTRADVDLATLCGKGT